MSRRFEPGHGGGLSRRGLLAGAAGAALAGTARGLLAQETAQKYPQVTFDNGVLKARVYVPNAQNGFYRGTRFDWSGIIDTVEYEGHRFFGEWAGPHDPLHHDHVTGPAEEFGTRGPLGPLGFADAKAGEPFVKIGVGVLEKGPNDDYRFTERYRLLRSGTWQTTAYPDEIIFRQTLPDSGGFAYQYEKTLRAKKGEPTFTLEHRLNNTGTRRIDTDWYCHNFTMIDGLPVGPDYVLTFPFEPRPSRESRFNGLADLKGRDLVFERELKDGESIMLFLGGFGKEKGDHGFTLRNRKAGAGYRVSGDEPLYRFNTWSARTALSPEPFIEIHLAPGAEKRWRTEYTFFKEGK